MRNRRPIAGSARAQAWAALGVVLALAGCGDLSLVDSLKGDSPGALQLSPDSVNLPTNKTFNFTAVGGIAPYYFISTGRGVVDKQTWTYTAPDTVSGAAGWDLVTLTATDLAGNSDTATVRVFLAFALSGGSPVVLTEGAAAYRFEASGGVEPYTWLPPEGGSAAGKYYDFNPTTAGTFLLAVHDSIDNYREAAITVVASGSPLAIDPAGATVKKSTTVTFTAFGGDGAGTYVWDATAGTLSISADTVTAQLTAPASAQNVTVTLSSNSGTYEPVTVQVVVTEGAPEIPRLELLPDAPRVDAVEDTVQFSVTGGTAPYFYELKNQYKNWATITPDGLYTHKKRGKDVVVTVSDSSAPFQTATTTVYWQE